MHVTFSSVIESFQLELSDDVISLAPRWSRHGWNGPGQFIELQAPDENSKMTLPYIFISTVKGDRVPWLASQTDLLAGDWYVVEESA